MQHLVSSKTPLTKPTRLGIKIHQKTGLKYFFATSKEWVEGYTGSGLAWREHIAENGKDIRTLWISDWYYYQEDIKKFALRFSRLNNIVLSDEWANGWPEDGIIDNYSSERFIHPEVKERAYKQMVVTRKKNKNGKYNDQDGKKNPTWSGYWIMPEGIYETLHEIKEEFGSASVARYCKENKKVLSQKIFRMSSYNFSVEDVGKTFEEIGFSFIPKESQDDQKLDCNVKGKQGETYVVQ